MYPRSITNINAYNIAGAYCHVKDFFIKWFCVVVLLSLWLTLNCACSVKSKDIIVSPVKSKAHVAVALYQECSDMFSNNQYKDALAKCQHALITSNSMKVQDYKLVAKIMRTMSSCHYCMSNYELALKYLISIVNISNIHETNSISSLVDDHTRIADQYAEIGKYSEAERYLAIASDLIVSNKLEKRWPSIYLLLSYSQLEERRNDYIQAKEYSKKALDRYSTCTNCSKDTEGLIFLTLGTIQLKLEEYNESYTSLNKAKEVYLNTTEPNYFYYPKTLMSISRVEYEWGQYEKSLKIIEEAEERLYSTTQNRHRYMAEAYLAKGAILREMKEYEGAIENFSKAIGVYRNISGRYGFEIAKLQKYIANVYYKMKRYVKADIHYVMAYEIDADELRGNNSWKGLIALKIAKTKRKLKKYPEALMFARKAKNVLCSETTLKKKKCESSIKIISDLEADISNVN
jgi:tetratricopeptide (TPR) repeat protein